jgi:hypothetical protein
MKTRLDKVNLLIQTAGFFNSTNRSVSVLGSGGASCLYRNLNPKLPGCAVGRLIKDKRLKGKLDDCDDSGIYKSEVWNLIPEDVKMWGQEFLTKLQAFHDTIQNWDENGLSSKGLEEFNFIKVMINTGAFDKDRFSPITEYEVE